MGWKNVRNFGTPVKAAFESRGFQGFRWVTLSLRKFKLDFRKWLLLKNKTLLSTLLTNFLFWAGPRTQNTSSFLCYHVCSIFSSSTFFLFLLSSPLHLYSSFPFQLISHYPPLFLLYSSPIIFLILLFCFLQSSPSLSSPLQLSSSLFLFLLSTEL